MSERTHLATQYVQSRVRMQPWRILACLAALLAAAALTYGWDALTSASHVAPTQPMLPFGARAALSAVLVFLGAFILTGLWLSPATNASTAAASAVPALAKAPAAEETREDDADQVTPHIPVPAADLPRILFDTGELPAVAPNDESKPNRTGRATKPLSWPQRILPPDWPDD